MADLWFACLWQKLYHGGRLSRDDYDNGNKGKNLKDFVNHKNSRHSHLSQANVLSVRLYTTSSFKRLNMPLRNKIQPHPFKMTIYYLDEGLRQLRTVAAFDMGSFSRESLLYRLVLHVAAVFYWCDVYLYEE